MFPSCSWQQHHQPEDVVKSLDESLQRMKLQYGRDPRIHEEELCLTKPIVDLYLMHWPLAFKRASDYEALTNADGKVGDLNMWSFRLTTERVNSSKSYTDPT